MDRKDARRERDDRYCVRISDPGEVAAAVPYLLGFHPSESLVLVALGGAGGGEVRLTARSDLPPPDHAAQLARDMAGRIATDDPRAVLAVIVSESADVGRDSPELPHRDLAHEVVLALAGHGLPVRDLLLVRGGRWWSYDCPHPCCAPGTGTPLPAGVSELAVASVTAGTVVAADRTALVARLAPEGGPAAAAVETACRERIAADVARAPDLGPAALAAETWTAIAGAVGRRAAGAPVAERLGDAELARILCGLRDPAVRDVALGLAVGREPAAAEELWTECTRRAPEPLVAAPATLVAVSAWLRGDGALANVALDRALSAEPGYRLAGQLADALTACLPPAQLRALVAAAVAEAGLPSGAVTAPGPRPVG